MPLGKMMTDVAKLIERCKNCGKSLPLMVLYMGMRKAYFIKPLYDKY